MVYLLDANVLIDANRDYYAIDRVPEFWNWLEHQGSLGTIKIPIEIFEELKDGTDALALWIKKQEVKAALLHASEVQSQLVSKAVYEGYAPDINDIEVEKLGRDPFLIAHALVDPTNHCIVTTEVSKPSRKRANRHLPDVARSFGICSCNTFEMTKALDFRTNWNQQE